MINDSFFSLLINFLFLVAIAILVVASVNRGKKLKNMMTKRIVIGLWIACVVLVGAFMFFDLSEGRLSDVLLHIPLVVLLFLHAYNATKWKIGEAYPNLMTLFKR